MKQMRVLLAALAGFLVAAFQAQAQGVATIVVPYPAGGPSDFVARAVQPGLQKALGQNLIVDNVGGVGGALGIQKALSAAPDSHTMVLASPMELVLAPLTVQAVKHKPQDLRPAGIMVATTLVLAVRKDLPASTVEQLLAQQKAAGAKPLTYGSSGNGSLYHIVGEVFSQQTGIAMTHVPYKGVAPLITDLIGGQIDMAFLPVAGSVPQMIKEGKIKAFGVTARAPHPLFPSLPPLAANKALDKLDFSLWAGLFVSSKAPDAAVQKLNAALATVMANPEVRASLESTGNFIVPPMSGAALDAYYAAEVARFTTLAKAANVQPQ